MSDATPQELLDEVLTRFEPPERAGVAGFVLEETHCPHPWLPDAALWVTRRFEQGESHIQIWGGSIDASLAPTEVADRLEDALVEALTRHHEDLACKQALTDEGALFAAHAAFRRGDPVLPGWYRQGAVFLPGVWLVDHDLFLDLVLHPEELEALRGGTLRLTIGDEELALEVPPEAVPDEAWTVPAAGVFEPAPGAPDNEELEEDELPDGQYGDLHVIPSFIERESGDD